MLAVFDLTEDQLPDDGQTLQWSCQAIRVFSRNRWCTLLGENRSRTASCTVVRIPFLHCQRWSFDQVLWTLIKRPLRPFVKFWVPHGSLWIGCVPAADFFMASFLVPVPVHGHAWTSSTASLLKCWVSWRSRWGRESLHWVIFDWSLWGSGWNSSNRMGNEGKRGDGATTHCVFLLSQLGGLRDSPGVTTGERKSAWPLGVVYEFKHVL